MLSRVIDRPRRILMTLDAVGGVWRHAIELAATLKSEGVETVFSGLGPRPTSAQIAEAQRAGTLVWLDAPLDWMAERDSDLDAVPHLIRSAAADFNVDLIHLNLPSQAHGLDVSVPVIVVSHSCVVTWFDAVRGTPVPENWSWQKAANRAGFDAADAVVAPSRSHADMLERCGPIGQLTVVPNAVAMRSDAAAKEPFVLAAGRWWDEGKNALVLDAAVPTCCWPIELAGPTAGPNGQHVELRHAHALGEVGNRDLRALMARAGIFVSPSLYEPFGLAVLEAAQAECALVLADIPTYREFWDGAALFADPRDANAFAAALNRLAEDAELRTEMGRRARERSEQFSLAQQARAFLDIYRAVLSGPVRQNAAA